MYSNSSVAVDKGLGFDFLAISDLVKSALPVGLNIFQQQQQLKAIKSGYAPLPLTQLSFGQPGYVPPPQSSMFSTNTMLMIGAAGVIGVLAYKMLR